MTDGLLFMQQISDFCVACVGRIYLPTSEHGPAVAILCGNGTCARCNGNGLTVQRQVIHKC